MNWKELLFLLAESQLTGRETPEQEMRFQMEAKLTCKSRFPQPSRRERGKGDHPPKRPTWTLAGLPCYSEIILSWFLYYFQEV